MCKPSSSSDPRLLVQISGVLWWPPLSSAAAVCELYLCAASSCHSLAVVGAVAEAAAVTALGRKRICVESPATLSHNGILSLLSL